MMPKPETRRPMPLCELAERLGHRPEYLREHFEDFRSKGMPAALPRRREKSRIYFDRARAEAWLANPTAPTPVAANDASPGIVPRATTAWQKRLAREYGGA